MDYRGRQLHSFKDVDDFLLSLITPSRRERPYTLDLMKKLMRHLGDPQNKLRVIHIAGTSGKTSTAYYTTALLQESGFSTGLSVSPHVDTVAERAQINLVPLDEETYCRYFNEFLQAIKGFDDMPSYFEFLVAFGFWLFHEVGVDYAVVEVGLGGLLDGTNVIDRTDKICVITDIGFDHIEILGNTLPEITRQKAGIITTRNRVFMHEQPREVIDIVRATCRGKHANLQVVDSNPSEGLSIPLFQKRNLDLAIPVVNDIRKEHGLDSLTTTEIKAVSTTYIPARMEIVPIPNKRVILDGSHNGQKIQSLVQAIKEAFPDTKFFILFSIGTNKVSSAQEVLQLLHSISETIIITTFIMHQDTKRTAIDPRTITKYCKEVGFSTIQVIANPEKALVQALASDNLLVTGSYYMLNHVRPILKKQSKSRLNMVR